MKVSDLVGKTMVSAKVCDDERVDFVDTDGVEYSMYHDQDCCESVHVEDVVGELDHLVGVPLLMAEESYSGDNPKKHGDESYSYEDDSHTWTFYKFATVLGYVTVRFYGSSNGYYGESARLHVNGEAQYD